MKLKVNSHAYPNQKLKLESTSPLRKCQNLLHLLQGVLFDGHLWIFSYERKIFTYQLYWMD